jgi:hypothetical protein
MSPFAALGTCPKLQLPAVFQLAVVPTQILLVANNCKVIKINENNMMET